MSGAKPRASAKAGIPENFRRLNWNELVRRGDLVADKQFRLEPWTGPAGFRADAFEKPIYRCNGGQPNPA
jgi:hypothetical protein